MSTRRFELEPPRLLRGASDKPGMEVVVMRGRRIVAIVFGVLGILAGAVLIAGGVSVLTEDRDDDGFFTTDRYRFDRSSHAIVSEDLDILSHAPAWVVDVFADPLDLRITGRPTGGRELFVGIAETVDVDRYLSDVPHDQVTDVDFYDRSIKRVDYDRHAGNSEPAAPGDQGIWVASVDGFGTSTLDWDLDSGNWTVVVMNADGSAGVDAELAFGAKISHIIGIAWAVTAFGLLSVLGGAFLMYRGSRRSTEVEPREPDPHEPLDHLDLRAIPDPVGEPVVEQAELQNKPVSRI